LATVSLLAMSLPAAAPAVAAAGVLQRAQDASTPQDLDRLRAMLQQIGPDSRDAREAAIERLLAMADPAAHRVLQERLRQNDDTDAVREGILRGLQRALLGTAATCFGGAGDQARRQIVTGYLAALAPLWSEPGQPIDDLVDNPVRAAARLALQRVPVRDLDAAARVLLAGPEIEVRCQVLRCLADMQQVLLAQAIADCLDAAEESVRAEARRCLQRLTCHEEEFQTKAQFAAWFERNGSARYVDLAERAARRGPRLSERLRDELARARVDAARDVVQALTARAPGLDWAAIQARTLVDDPAVLDACLEQLQQSLAAGLPGDDQAAPRQAFCRALLQRFRQIAVDQVRRRALLLEVSAYLTRTEDAELANEVESLLVAQLELADTSVHIAALRGLRRFPGVETRSRLVRYATRLLDAGPATKEQLLATFATLASRSAPRWHAPSSTDPDRAEWIALVSAACRMQADQDVRAAGLSLAQTLDAREQRCAEAFQMLLELVKDPNQDARFRSTCLIQMQGWRNQQEAADGYVRLLRDLLQDAAPELRQQAAESLARLPESIDPRRSEWIGATISAIEKRLDVEPNPPVLRALVDCLLACSREPQMPERAIGALNVVAKWKDEVPPEHQFRLDPLLQALATVAADPHTEPGQWLAACKWLAHFQKRQSLRLVLKGHGAADLARSVKADDASLAEAARLSMQFLIKAAVMKSSKDPWSSTEALQREAQEVRMAFAALDTVDEKDRLDELSHRLLRLEIDLALAKYQDVVQRAAVWLGNGTAATNGNGGSTGSEPRRAMTAVERDRMRMLAAEAHLALGKPDVAARMLTELRVDMAKDAAVLDIQSRIARAWFPTDPAAAVALLATTWKATSPDDPSFRQRLLDWMTYRIRHEPSSRDATLQEAEPHRELFLRQDCPVDLRDAFAQLRASR